MADQPIEALRITGDTLNKIMHIDRDILDMKLGDLWNHYYVLNFPVPEQKLARKTRPATTTSVIMTPDTFHRTLRWKNKTQPRYNFATVERIS